MKEYSFIISGGGTGGHIYPAIAIADALKEKYPNAKFMFVGAADRMEMQKVPNAGYPIEGLWISGFQRSNMLKNLLLPFKVVSSMFKSFLILKKHKPDIAIGTGGYASAALLKTAGLIGVKTLIQEQNSFPGITNKILAGNASKICVAYDGLDTYFSKDKIVKTGNPLRGQIVNLNIASAEAKNQFELDVNKKTLLVLGGSLGARTINNLIAKKLEYLLNLGFNIIWQCGKLYYDEFKSLENKHVKIVAFIDRMDLAYSAADIIISRAGASSVSELAVVGKPTVFIPSPNVAEDHQTKNALAIVDKDAAILIKEKDLELNFDNELQNLISNQDLLRTLSANFKALAQPNATESIVKEIEKIIEK